MNALKALAARGKGNVAVILPDTVSSTRYVEFDAPYLKKALTDAGLTSSQISHPERAGQRRHPVLRMPRPTSPRARPC